MLKYQKEVSIFIKSARKALRRIVTEILILFSCVRIVSTFLPLISFISYLMVARTVSAIAIVKLLVVGLGNN
jgi:hypothetical protein